MPPVTRGRHPPNPGARIAPASAGRVTDERTRMNIYLTLKSIPELRALTANERKLAWWACRRRTWGHWQTIVGTVLAVTAGVAAGGAVLYGLVEFFGPFKTYNQKLAVFFACGFLSGGIVIGITEYLRMVAVSSQIRPYLREYLEANGIAPRDNGEAPGTG